MLAAFARPMCVLILGSLLIVAPALLSAALSQGRCPGRMDPKELIVDTDTSLHASEVSICQGSTVLVRASLCIGPSCTARAQPGGGTHL